MGYILILIVLGIIYYVLKDRRDSKNFDLLPEQFVVFDLETTGLDAAIHEITQIGAMRVYRQSTVPQMFHALVKPQATILKETVDLADNTLEVPDLDGEVLTDALVGFIAFVGDAPLVSFNAKFNMEFLNAAMAKCNRPPLGNRVSCALNMARRAWPNLDSYLLADFAKEEDVEIDGGHRVLEDCRRILTVYDAAAFTLKAVS